MRVLIMGDITEVNCGAAVLATLGTKDKTVYIYIDSDGGDTDAALTLFSVLRACKKRIVTIVLNRCKSSAVIIALAGHERYALEGTSYMIHKIKYEEVEGDVDDEDIENLKHEMAMDSKQFFDKICNNSKLTLPKIKKQMADSKGGDWEFNVSVAKRYGLVTHLGLPTIEDEV